jgi:hypothetical protein
LHDDIEKVSRVLAPEITRSDADVEGCDNLGDSVGVVLVQNGVVDPPDILENKLDEQRLEGATVETLVTCGVSFEGQRMANSPTTRLVFGSRYQGPQRTRRRLASLILSLSA